MAVLHLLAGPNGAGKSSYVRDVLMPATQLPFINVGEFAAERWPDSPVEHAYEAARIAAAAFSDDLAIADDDLVDAFMRQLHRIIDHARAGNLDRGIPTEGEAAPGGAAAKRVSAALAHAEQVRLSTR